MLHCGYAYTIANHCCKHISLKTSKGNEYGDKRRGQRSGDSKLHPESHRKMVASPYNLDATLSTRSRRDLKHDALVLASGCVGCAKDISIFIHGYAAVRLRTIAAADEVVKVGKGPAVLSRN
jgi:hypothetical protein